MSSFSVEIGVVRSQGVEGQCLEMKNIFKVLTRHIERELWDHIYKPVCEYESGTL